MTDQPPAPEAPEKPKRRTGEKLPRKKLIVVRLSDNEFNDASERANRAGLTRAPLPASPCSEIQASVSRGGRRSRKSCSSARLAPWRI